MNKLARIRARLGVIIPTSNRMIEPQFQHFAPDGLGVHFMRARITGKWTRPLPELETEIVSAGVALADARPDLIAFHCTATSMKEGEAGERKLVAALENATGRSSLTTAGAVTQALGALAMRKIVLITPYVQPTNDHEIAYLRGKGIDTVRDVALGLSGGDQFIRIPSEKWIDVAIDQNGADFDGFLLSCANTTQIEAIDAIEKATSKPVVSVNQAMLWACIDRLRPALGDDAGWTLPGRLSRLRAGA